LEEIGVNMVIYSTPCLFAAHKAVDNAIKNLKKCNGVFGAKDAETSLLESNKVLTSNLK